MCEDGKMLAIHMHRGWGKEYEYKCNNCGHNKWIYEGSPSTGGKYENSKIGFWTLLIFVEIIVFFNDDIIGIVGYALYLSFIILFLYNLLTPNKLKLDYEIIGDIDKITPEEVDEEVQLNYSMKDDKFLLYPFVFMLSVGLTSYYDNYYFLILAVLSVVYAYYYGFLDISVHRKDKYFKDKKFEKEMDDVTIKIDSNGNPIYEE